MNTQKRKNSIKAKTNIRVIREGNLRLSDRRPLPFLAEEKPDPKIHSFISQSSINGHSNKMPSSVHHSFHSANEADRLLDLSASSSSSMSVKSCFGSFGTLKVKVPPSSLREVQNLPENLEIPLNSTSTPRSLSPECGPKKQVLVEKHSPCVKSFPSSYLLNADFKNGNSPNGLHKTEEKEFDLSDMVLASIGPKQTEIVTFSEQTKVDILTSDYVGQDGSEAYRKAVSDQKPRPIRVHQGSVATGKMLMQKKIPNNNASVQITNFSASDSLAARKALVAKKSQNAPVPIRRAVPAKAIISTNQPDTATEKKSVCHSCQEKSLLPDAVSAVAAATAAALSTQPLISSQNKLESQLSTLLEKINTLEQEAALKQKELENESKTQKIDKLETQLSQVTEERMKHLEQLQKQLFGMQTKFLRIARNFEKMSDADAGYCPQPQTQKPTQTPDENDVYLNSFLNTSVSQEITNKPSMNSGYQTFSAPLDQQNSITEDRSSLRSSICDDSDSKSANSEKIRATKHFNVNNSGKSNPNSVGQHHTAKNIYAPFLEKKPKDTKVPFLGKTSVTSTSSKSKENVRQKSGTVREASKNISQKKTSLVRNKAGRQQKSISKVVDSKHSKEKQNKSDVNCTSEIIQSSSVPVGSRYSVLKDFVSGRYSQQPYAVRETDSIPNPAAGRILNASYTVDDPIVEKDDASKGHFSQVETNRSELNKEAPLEKYLLQSPDKSVLFTQDKIYSGQQPSLPSAEVLAGQEILRKAQTSRMVLEANLQMVERDNEKDAVYGLVDNLYAGSPAAHRLQLRRKVDQCIAKVQKDIQNELSQAKSLHSPPPPPGKTKSQKSTGAPNGPKNPVANKKVFVNKDKSRDSEYLSQVFGKAAYQNKRTTVKNPYLRFQNNPKTKSPRPKETVPVKGIRMRSAKTQTPQEKEEISKPKASNQPRRPVPCDNKKYFFASASNEHPSSINLQHGHLGYMAVALREPRMDSGLKVPVTIRAGDSLTMAPEDQPKIVPARNVMVCNIPVCDEEHVIKKRPALVKQTLPCVVIEAQQETSQPCKNLVSNSKPSTEEPKMVSHKNIVISDEDLDEEVDAYSESSESVAASDDDDDDKQEPLIIFSGYNSKLTGGKTSRLVEKRSVDEIFDSLHDQDFVPLVPFVPEANISGESTKRNHLQNDVLQWVEQEIVSQMFSYSSQQPPLPSSDFDPKTNAPNPETVPTVPSSFQASNITSPFFDKALISQLVEELLVDKVNDMMKETLAEESTRHPVGSDPASPQNESVSTSEKIVASPETPELTPEVSEEIVASPEPDVPLPQTPSLSPEPSEENLPHTEPSLLNTSKVEKNLLHAALKQEIDKLREEESFQATHTEEAAAADLEPVVTPQQTPRLSPVQDASLVTPVGSPTFPPELLNENIEEQVPIRTPSPSIFSPENTEEAVDSRQSELHLTHNQDNAPPIKEAIEDDTSLKDARITAVDDNQSMKRLESASEETSSVSTTQSESETIFESLSVGQWLLSKSEGEAADFGINERAYRQILNDASTASTLRDTEDLFHDETTEMTYSEGEVVYKSRVPPEKDPILELVSQMQNRDPLSVPAAVLLLSNNEGSAVRRSLGEFPLMDLEHDPVMGPPGKSPTDSSSRGERKPLKLQQPELAQAVTSHSDLEEEILSEKEICPPQKGARVIEVGKRVAMEPVSSKGDPTKWKGAPSRIEVGSMSDSDQTNFMQKSVRFNDDGHMSSIDYAAYLDSSSDLVASDMEKFSGRSSHESLLSHGDIFQEEPEHRRRMSVMIPQPDVLDEEDIEEISLGEEK